MAKKFQWPKSRVERVLSKFKKRDMIRDTIRDGAKVYFIKNYDRYQFEPLFERDTNGTQIETLSGQKRDRSGTNLNNDNNEITNIDSSNGSEGSDEASKKEAQKGVVEPEGFNAFYLRITRDAARINKEREIKKDCILFSFSAIHCSVQEKSCVTRGTAGGR